MVASLITDARDGPLAYRVLVLGETNASRMLLRQLLLRQGIRAFLCEADEGALNAIERTQPDLVLFDVTGPTESELMALQRIRNCCAATMPLIVVLPSRVRAAIARCIEAGANDFLTWPVDWMSWWPRLRAHLFAPQSDAAQEAARREGWRLPSRNESGDLAAAPRHAYRGERLQAAPQGEAHGGAQGRRLNLRV